MHPPSGRRAFAVLALLVCAGAEARAAARSQGLCLRGVHVVDLDAGVVLRDQSLRIEGERIAALGPAATLRPAADDTIVEGGGRYLLPGLCDMHVHLTEDSAADTLTLFLANGITTVQCMGGSPWHLALREQLARGERFGPRLFTTGPTTAALRVHAVEEAERVVRAQKAAGYDALKMYGDGSDTMPLETYRRLVALGHELGIRVVGHAPRNLPFAAVLEARQDSIDHMEEIVYTDERLGAVVAPYVDMQFARARFLDHAELLGEVPDFRPPLQAAIAALASEVRAAGMTVTPTLSTFAAIQGSIDAGYFQMLARPELAYVAPTVRQRWAPDQARFRNGSWKPHLAFMARALARSLELQSELVRAFQAAGVPLMTGTDAPFDFVVAGFSLHDELALFVAAGLTPLEALRSATLVPARFRALEDGSGSIRAGARADLVLLEANPLEDIAATRTVAGVFQAGRWNSPASLAQRLDAIARANTALVGRMARIRAALDSGSPAQAVDAYHADGDHPHLAAWLEDLLNERGHALLGARKLDDALAMLRLNAATFPGSANAWDSLGEVQLARDELEPALESYERALELDPESASSMRAIDRIVERLAEASRR